MNMNDAVGALAAEIAKDVKNVEAAVVTLAAKVDQKLAGVSPADTASALQALTDEVHSVIDDAVEQSPGNTWSIDKIKAFVAEEIAKAVAAAVEKAVSQMASPAGTQADFAATYRTAKVIGPTPAPAPAPENALAPQA